MFKKQTKIHVIDAPMGSGKTFGVFQLMNQWQDEGKFSQFVYITPNKTELDRVVAAMDTPEGTKDSKGRLMESLSVPFRVPVTDDTHDTKTSAALDVLVEGDSLATTHMLFHGLSATEATMSLTYTSNNVLVMDESIDVIEHYTGLKRGKKAGEDDEFLDLLQRGWVDVDEETSQIRWVGEEPPLRYKEVHQLCEAGSLYYISGKIIMWSLPLDFLTAFDEVYIVTYQFEGSILCGWLQMHGLEWDSFEVPLRFTDEEVRAQAKELITIVGKGCNFNCSDSSIISMTPDEKKKMVTKAESAVKNSMKGPDGSMPKFGDLLWTCPKANMESLGGKGYNKATWLAPTARATNSYADRRAMVYLTKGGVSPNVVKFLKDNGGSIDRDMFTLNELLQWLFRSRIRNHEPVHIFIADKKVRTLLMKWLGYAKSEMF